MDSRASPPDPAPLPDPDDLTRLSVPVQWGLLLVASVLFAAFLEWLEIPAGMLIAPMLVAIVAGVRGATIRIPQPAFIVAQSFIGTLIAPSMTIGLFTTFLVSWPLFLAIVLSTLAASSVLGWAISQWKILPGTTGVWGSSPGGATAMMLMAGAFGADARLVAFMQYLRVLVVSLVAALIANMALPESALVGASGQWFPPIDAATAFWTLFVTAVGAGGARLLKMPSAYFLGAFFFATAMHLGFGVPIEVPLWLRAITYFIIGWAIGLSFTPDIVRHAMRALPQVLGSILLLIAFCGGLAIVVHRTLGIDLLTAYLATSPGGADSIAIISAAASGVDLSFVMALQMARLIIVIAFGPAIAKLVARLIRD